MKNEPIFELFRKPENSSGEQFVRIYVELNGERMPLIDALKIIEAPFVSGSMPLGGYSWTWAATFYERFLEYRNREWDYWHVLTRREWGFYVTMTETEDSVE